MKIETIDISREVGVVGDLIRLAFSEVASRMGFTRENSPTYPAFIENQRLLGQLGKPGARAMGIRENGKLVGFVAVAPHGNGYEITRLAVDPAYRHKGYGRLLMDTACDAAREMGLSEIGLGVVNENTVLKKWYEAQGFVPGEPFSIPNAAFTACGMLKKL